MTRISNLRNALRIALILSVFSGLASASTIVATGVDGNRGDYYLWLDLDGIPQQVYFSGVITITLTLTDGQQYNRDTLCVDLFTDIYLGVTYDTDVLHPYQVPGRDLEQVSWLVDNALLPTQNTGINSVLPESDWVETPAQGAGIQIAIWDITTDGGDGLSAGEVQASTAPGELTDPSVLSWAETYEALSSGMSSDQAYVYDNWAIGSGIPAQMLEGPMFVDGGPHPDPEPATYALVGVALIALCVRRRKQQPGLRR